MTIVQYTKGYGNAKDGDIDGDYPSRPYSDFLLLRCIVFVQHTLLLILILFPFPFFPFLFFLFFHFSIFFHFFLFSIHSSTYSSVVRQFRLPSPRAVSSAVSSSHTASHATSAYFLHHNETAAAGGGGGGKGGAASSSSGGGRGGGEAAAEAEALLKASEATLRFAVAEAAAQAGLIAEFTFADKVNKQHTSKRKSEKAKKQKKNLFTRKQMKSFAMFPR